MNVEPKKLLWPTDFSELSLAALPFVEGYHARFNAEIHVIHVCTPLPNPNQLPVGLTLTESDLSILNTFLNDAKSRLEQLVRDKLGGVTSLRCEVLGGHPWSEICDYANTHEIDLIIITTQGLTGLRHVLMGSIAERVVCHAPCPVLTIKPA